MWMEGISSRNGTIYTVEEYCLHYGFCYSNEHQYYLQTIAWRCAGKLNHLVRCPSYDDPKEGEELLDLVIDQLCTARDLMKGDKKYHIPISTKIQLDNNDSQSIEVKKNGQGDDDGERK